MGIALLRLRPGATATGWLTRRLRLLQADDPLRSVTVVVPSHQAGLHLRRRLAGEGYASVRFTVLSRLAESLGASRLAAESRAPVTAITRAALTRRALRDAGGPLSASAEHTGLVDLVARLAGELRRSRRSAANLAQSGPTDTTTGRAVLDTIAEYDRRRRAAHLYDEVDLLDAAAGAVTDGGAEAALADIGTLIVHLPAALEPRDVTLLRALAQRVAVIVALADLGEELDDSKLITGIDGAHAAWSRPTSDAPASIAAVIAPEPVEEVRAAVRDLLAAAERDHPVPLHRTAIVFRDEETYAGLLRDTLDEAGIPHVVLDGRRLIDSVPARGLLGLVQLREQGFTRGSVLSWLSGLPHRRGILLDQARWDQLSRDAGVIRGADQWRHRLAVLIESRRRSLDRLDNGAEDDTAEAHRAALGRDIDDASSIIEHVAAIDVATTPPASRTWQSHVDWLLRLRDEFLTPDAAWSDEDREASQAVEEVVRSLVAADAAEATVSVGVVLRTLEDGLGARRRPQGRSGRGVIVGPHRLLLGIDVARVHVLGVVETSFPARPPVDPLLSGDPLDRRGVHETRERRDWLVTLAAADGGEVVLSAPRLDVEGRAVYPSPWLLDALTDQGGRPRASAVRGGTARHSGLSRVPSSGTALARHTPLSLAERREAEALGAHAAGLDLARSALAARPDLPLGRSLEAARARRSDSLTAFDGNLAEAVDLPLISRGLAGDPQSATGVQTWATCPFHFLLGRVLVVSATQDVDDDRWWQISPAERGTLIHGILERFFREVAATGRPRPGEPYTDTDVARIEAIASDAFSDAERRGVTGHRLVWANDRAAILSDLRSLLREDAELRAAGWRPAHLEQPFGIDRDERSWPAVVVPLEDGRSVALRGYIDRVDGDDEGRAQIIDYKTGKKTKTTISVDSLFDGGRNLQLPVYGRAVRDHRPEGVAAASATALYWYVTVGSGFARIPLEVDDQVEAVLTDVIGRIDTGIRAGCFPQVPGEFLEHRRVCQNCCYCPYDTLCPAGREVLAQAKADSPAREPFGALQPASVEEEA